MYNGLVYNVRGSVERIVVYVFCARGVRGRVEHPTTPVFRGWGGAPISLGQRIAAPCPCDSDTSQWTVCLPSQ